MSPFPRDAIAAAITAHTGRRFRIEHQQALAGGSINRAFAIEGGGERYFVKLNAAERLAMFEAEALGLAEMAATRTVRVPAVVCHGADATSAWLVLEWMAIGAASPGGAAALGASLARMHASPPGRAEDTVARPSPPLRRAGAPGLGVQTGDGPASAGRAGHRFGWVRDNTIGSTPQTNAWADDWAEFWVSRRLGPQLELAACNGHTGRLQREGERLLARVPDLLRGHRPQPSLLHGDLWGGNAAVDAAGAPFVFDPAVYHGDRETDLAMTELFGGFDPAFRAAYRDTWPLADGYETRRHLYNLYHVLNHLNLFGGAYLGQAEATIGRLIALAS